MINVHREVTILDSIILAVKAEELNLIYFMRFQGNSKHYVNFYTFCKDLEEARILFESVNERKEEYEDLVKKTKSFKPLNWDTYINKGK